jgi:hypothetical protein
LTDEAEVDEAPTAARYHRASIPRLHLSTDPALKGLCVLSERRKRTATRGNVADAASAAFVTAARPGVTSNVTTRPTPHLAMRILTGVSEPAIRSARRLDLGIGGDLLISAGQGRITGWSRPRTATTTAPTAQARGTSAA